MIQIDYILQFIKFVTIKNHVIFQSSQGYNKYEVRKRLKL